MTRRLLNSMGKLSTKNLSVVVCIAAILYILTVATTSNAQSKRDNKETSISTKDTTGVATAAAAASGSSTLGNKVIKASKPQTNDKFLKANTGSLGRRVRDVSSAAGGIAAKSLDLDWAEGGKKYMLVKKKPKLKKIKMEVYKPKMKYKKIKMKVPIKKLKKKKVKGYMVKKKKHYY